MSDTQRRSWWYDDKKALLGLVLIRWRSIATTVRSSKSTKSGHRTHWWNLSPRPEPAVAMRQYLGFWQLVYRTCEYADNPWYAWLMSTVLTRWELPSAKNATWAIKTEKIARNDSTSREFGWLFSITRSTFGITHSKTESTASVGRCADLNTSCTTGHIANSIARKSCLSASFMF